MSALIPFLTIELTCEHVQAWVKEELTGAGFRVMQTFDLQGARLAHPDCPCPHHGTDDCNCQMVVFLVYQKEGDPATLVIHGQDGKTWLSLVNPTGQRVNQRLEAAIRCTLIPGLPKSFVPVEVTHAARSRV